MPSPLQALVAREARRVSYEDRIGRTLDRIRRALDNSRRPYVAFSGGKDSTTMLSLAIMAGGIGHGALAVCYTDDELLLPEHVAYVDRMAEAMRYHGLPFHHYQGGSVHAGWHRPWTDTPYWRERPDMEPVPGTGMLAREAAKMSYDLCFLGRRAGESARRAESLFNSGGVSVLHGVTIVEPIWDWTDDNVWEHLYRWRGPDSLEWCPVYDILQQEVGLDRVKCRVGPIPLMSRDQLMLGWPDVYARLVSRYGPRWN